MMKTSLLLPMIIMVSCASNQSKHQDMGLFDRLFGKKETPKEEKHETPNKPESSDKLMDSETFWKIIESSKSASSGDYQKQQQALGDELSKLEAIEIIEFDNRFRKLRGDVYNWDFWAAAYIINGGCSDDCFMDFRGWLIGQGKTTFEAAMENVESLAGLTNTNDGDWEGIGYVADDAYERKTGNNMPRGFRENFDLTGEEWEEDAAVLKQRFPAIWEKFGWDE